MATSQLATSSFLSTKTFNGLRPRLGFSNLSVSVCSSPKSFKAAVVLNATTVAASKYTSLKPLGDRILIKTKIVDEKTVPRSQFRSFSLSPRWSNHRLYLPSASPVAASVTSLDSPSASSTDEDGKKLLLEVKDLTAVIAESGEKILHGVDLSVYEGEVHAIMGKNGSGKSTFAKVLVGHPDYEVTGGIVTYKGENLLNMEAEERSLAGLFLSFQSPVEIPGVSNSDFLNMAYNARRRKLGLPELGPIEFFGHLLSKLTLVNMKPDFLNRNVNVGFSGGEKKRNEILQLAVLEAELAILDEIDSGLDVDALRDVATAVNGLLTPTNSVLMITHYQRLLDYIKPTYIHIMENGRIVKTGDSSLAKVLEKGGYKAISDA